MATPRGPDTPPFLSGALKGSRYREPVAEEVWKRSHVSCMISAALSRWRSRRCSSRQRRNSLGGRCSHSRGPLRHAVVLMQASKS